MNTKEIIESYDVLDKLIAKYPVVFSHMEDSDSSIPSGWYKLLDELCAELHEMLSAELMENPDTKEEPLFTILQIKEKFGGLRFYYSLNTRNEEFFKRFQSRIDRAEDDSYFICEITGKPGGICKKGWHFRTLCEECQRSHGYTKIETTGSDLPA